MAHHHSILAGFHRQRAIIWIFHSIIAIALGVYLTLDYKSLYHEYYTSSLDIAIPVNYAFLVCPCAFLLFSVIIIFAKRLNVFRDEHNHSDIFILLNFILMAVSMN